MQLRAGEPVAAVVAAAGKVCCTGCGPALPPIPNFTTSPPSCNCSRGARHRALWLRVLPVLRHDRVLRQDQHEHPAGGRAAAHAGWVALGGERAQGRRAGGQESVHNLLSNWCDARQPSSHSYHMR